MLSVERMRYLFDGFPSIGGACGDEGHTMTVGFFGMSRAS